LLNRFGTFIDIDFVLSQLSRDTWHVGRLPSEDIFIVSEKVGEREFLFVGEVSADDRCLGGITSLQIDIFDICFFGWGEDMGLFAGISSSSGFISSAMVATSFLSSAA
jgi:hypothetical protein